MNNEDILLVLHNCVYDFGCSTVSPPLALDIKLIAMRKIGNLLSHVVPFIGE